MAQTRRRDVRYSMRFPVRVTAQKRVWSLVTEDVSEGGVFVATNDPPPLLQLVRVQLALPIGGHALTAHGMTVHVVGPEDAALRLPGIGIQFYGLDHATRDAWEAFARHVATSCPKSKDQTPLVLARGETPEPLSRRLGRHKAILDLLPRDLEALQELYSSEVSSGTLFVPTAQVLPPETPVIVKVTHPVSAAPFLFEAKVKVEGHKPAGLHLALVGVDRRFREDFLDFVRGGVVFDSESVATGEPPRKKSR
jgi:Tfp pilus assembly protein PilZ